MYAFPSPHRLRPQCFKYRCVIVEYMPKRKVTCEDATLKGVIRTKKGEFKGKFHGCLYPRYTMEVEGTCRGADKNLTSFKKCDVNITMARKFMLDPNEAKRLKLKARTVEYITKFDTHKKSDIRIEQCYPKSEVAAPKPKYGLTIIDEENVIATTPSDTRCSIKVGDRHYSPASLRLFI